MAKPRFFSDETIRIALILRAQGFKWKHVAKILKVDSYAIKYLERIGEIK